MISPELCLAIDLISSKSFLDRSEDLDTTESAPLLFFFFCLSSNLC